jgi:hypothetical protein
VSNEFVALCDQEGMVCDMVHPTTSPIAERMNITIMDMVISMLGNKCLPKELLGDVVSSVTYVLNICPKRLKGITPKKCWSGNKSSVIHFKEFDSIA